MDRKSIGKAIGLCCIAASLLGLGGCASSGSGTTNAATPAFRVDTAWPRPLPNNWILGQVSGVATDAQDHVWVLQRPRSLGKVGPQTSNADTTRLGKAAGVEVDAAANEVYVADGYQNRRVIVFDAETGAYKRHWGAYGKPPSDAEKPVGRRQLPPTAAQLQQFGTPVHCVRIARDGLVYVCDRLNNRIQVFRKDGSYVKEFMIEPRTAGNGSVWDVVISRDPQQKWLFLADGRNNQVLTLDRQTGAVLGTLGRPGRYAGEFHWVHDLAIDSQGNIFAGEVDNGKRVQKFSRVQ